MTESQENLLELIEQALIERKMLRENRKLTQTALHLFAEKYGGTLPAGADDVLRLIMDNA